MDIAGENLLLYHGDIGILPALLIEVEPIAHNKKIVDHDTAVIRLQFHHSAGRFIQKCANFQ